MKHVSIFVRAAWDEEACVWVASTNDIDGLAVEAESVELLEKKVVAAISDLLEMNGADYDVPEIPVHFMTEHVARIPNPRY